MPTVDVPRAAVVRAGLCSACAACAIIIENPIGHRELRLGERRALARSLRQQRLHHGRLVLPNFVQVGADPMDGRAFRAASATPGKRAGSCSPMPGGSIAKRCRAWSTGSWHSPAQPGELVPTSAAPVLVPDAANAAEAIRALGLSTHRPVAILCPGAEFGAGQALAAPSISSRWRSASSIRDTSCWLVGSPNDRVAADPIAAAIPEVRGVTCGRTDLGTAIDLLATASVVVSNDSGLMHAAAAVGRPLVALFGSSSPDYTPPLSPLARVAKIEIVCSPMLPAGMPARPLRACANLSPNACAYDLRARAKALRRRWPRPVLRRSSPRPRMRRWRSIRRSEARGRRRDDGDLGRGRGVSSASIPADRAWSATRRCAPAGSSCSPATQAVVSPRRRHDGRDGRTGDAERDRTGLPSAATPSPRGVAIVTNVFLRTPSGWRMVMHHSSPAPAIAAIQPARSALHR